MRISDWSSDVCSSDLTVLKAGEALRIGTGLPFQHNRATVRQDQPVPDQQHPPLAEGDAAVVLADQPCSLRSEEHTSELQSLMSSSYAVFCLEKINSDLVGVTLDK